MQSFSTTTCETIPDVMAVNTLYGRSTKVDTRGQFSMSSRLKAVIKCHCASLRPDWAATINPSEVNKEADDRNRCTLVHGMVHACGMRIIQLFSMPRRERPSHATDR